MSARKIKRRAMKQMQAFPARVERSYRQLAESLHLDQSLMDQWRQALKDKRRPSSLARLLNQPM